MPPLLIQGYAGEEPDRRSTVDGPPKAGGHRAKRAPMQDLNGNAAPGFLARMK